MCTGFGSIKFRSPAEFEDHLLWLASNQSTHCLCKYCSRDSTPRKRTTPQQTSQKNSQAIITPSSTTTTTTTTPSQMVFNSKSKTPTPTSNKMVQHPSDMSHYSRNGEIVWIKTTLTLSENYLEELKKGKVKIEHWPGYVVERQKFSQVVNNVASGSLIDNLYYKVQPLNVAGTQKASEEQVVPWLLLSSESLVEKIYKMRDDYAANQKTYSPALMHVINLFCSACDTARRISKTYTPLDSYKYTLPPLFLSNIDDPNERRLLEEMEKYSHYKSLCFGTEILKEDDYVRMNDAESKGDNIRIFKINTIYKKTDNKILFNGDIYLKSFTKGDKINWSRLNDEDREYFIELKEISGRYYDKCPFINKSMEVNKEISFNERKELIEANKSKPGPSQPVIRKQTAKRSTYFDNPSNNPSKKLKTQDGNTTPQQKILKQNNQQEKDVRQNNHDELDTDLREVQQMVDPIIISPTIPFLDEPEDEISETESNLFEMLSNNPENPQLMTR
jgi:hypothetical protein